MAFADYDDFLALAKELINEAGETCSWQRPVASPNNSQPWNPDDDAPVEFNGIVICWNPSVIRNFQAFGIDLSKEVPDGFLFGVMAGDVPFTPMDGDVIIRSDGSPLNFVAPSDVVAPDGRPIIYLVRAAK